MIVIVQQAQVLVSDITQTCGHGSQFIKRLCQTFSGVIYCLLFSLYFSIYTCVYVTTSWKLSFFNSETLKIRKLCSKFFGLIFVVFGGVCKDQVKSLFPRCFFEKGKVLELMFLPLFSDNLRIRFTSWWWWWCWWWWWQFSLCSSTSGQSLNLIVLWSGWKFESVRLEKLKSFALKPTCLHWTRVDKFIV